MNVYDITASVISGLISSMGMGGGGILIIYLSTILNYPQMLSQGINLLFFIPPAIIAVVKYCKIKMIKFSKIKELYYLLIPGALAGFYLTRITDKEIPGKIFGAFLIISGLYELFRKNQYTAKKP